tara:strand:- start:6876 stop:7127 length:252 start_codon:yes stop_codon:yes gene_type:complete
VRRSILFPYLCGEEVVVTRDTFISDWGLNITVPMGTIGRVVQIESFQGKVWLSFQDFDRYIPFPMINILPRGQDVQLQVRIQR